MYIKNIFNYDRKQKGQSLIEILLALSTLVLIISAITIVTISSLNNSQFIKNQNLANKYAQEGIEIIKNWQAGSGGVLLDSKESFPSFQVFSADIGTSSKTYCLGDVSGQPWLLSAAPDCPANVAQTFKRKVIFSRILSQAPLVPGNERCGGSDIQVEVVASWSSSKCPAANPFCHNSDIISCFYSPGAPGL